MSYHGFNNLTKLLKGDLATRIVWVINPREFMDRAHILSNYSKVNGKCDFEGKYQRYFKSTK